MKVDYGTTAHLNEILTPNNDTDFDKSNDILR